MRARFGFLPCDWSIKFDGGDISPIPEIYKIRRAVEKHTNQDGFLYPPRSWRVRLEPKTNRRLGKIPEKGSNPLLALYIGSREGQFRKGSLYLDQP